MRKVKAAQRGTHTHIEDEKQHGASNRHTPTHMVKHKRTNKHHPIIRKREREREIMIKQG